MIDLEPIRTTPDQRLAQHMNDAGKPFEPLLENAHRAGLEEAEAALKTAKWWNAEKAYWDYARGEEATYFQTPFRIEVPGQGHIFHAADRWAFELSGPKGKVPGYTSPSGFGTEIRSRKFGTVLTPQYIDDAFGKGLQNDALVRDIYEIFGASGGHEITSHKHGITVFENDTNIGGTLYEVRKDRNVRLYAKRNNGQDRVLTPSPARSPDGHAVRLVTSDKLAFDMAMAENPFQLMRLNVDAAGRAARAPEFAAISEILNSSAFWESEKEYWMARMRDSYDLNRVLNSRLFYIYGVAHGVASELSGIEGTHRNEYGSLMRSDKYGSLLTRGMFQWGEEGSRDSGKDLPYNHPQVKKKIQSIYTLLGATEPEKRDVTSDQDRINGNTVFTYGTNLGLTGTEILNRTTGAVNLYVKRI